MTMATHHAPNLTAHEDDDVSYRTRTWVRPENLNANGTLFGGSLPRWIDEEGRPQPHGYADIAYDRDRLPLDTSR